MNKTEVCKKIEEIGIIAAIRVKSKEEALFAAEAVFQGGVPILEIALTVPGAIEVISYLVEHYPQAIVGAGSVMNAEMVQSCLDAGAHFLTSDGLNLAVVKCAKKEDVVVFPGVLTPTEVITAWECGCDFLKVVPCAHIGGESYIRSLHKMFPHIPLIAAGGVNQQTASNYIIAGAVALGIGREMIPSRAIRHQEAHQIQELSRRFFGFVKNARGGRIPDREGRFMQMPGTP